MRERGSPDDVIADFQSRRTPLLMVLSGPSGVGKDTVLEAMRQASPDIFFAVTATTRQQRPGEVDQLHYIFLSNSQFEAMLEKQEFLEHAYVYGNHYGVPREQVRRALERGQDVMIKVDVQGAASIRAIAPEAILIFLLPPGMEELTRRLRGRKTEDVDELLRRMRTAEREFEAVDVFDYAIINENDQVERTVSALQNIIEVERRRVQPRQVTL